MEQQGLTQKDLEPFIGSSGGVSEVLNHKRRLSLQIEALGHRLIAITVELHQGEDIGLGFKEPLYALDSTTIDLCLTLFPWADFRSTKAAVKAHTIIDLRGAIPVFVHITTGKVHDVKVLAVIHAGSHAFPLSDRIEAVPLAEMRQRVGKL